MASSDKELEEQLLEAGNKLTDLPSSVEELLPLLDQIESYLSRVEQSPTKSMQNALSPSLKALIAGELLRHSDDDVKVAVASCITEITRITAPDAPYDDDQMKEVFQLIVSSFENLYDTSNQSYSKRTSIIETVAKVRSCVVMLDLECDALIVEMFQHFFKAVREHHPENVLSSIETIMTLVIEESEEISVDLLSPILASVKKDNEEYLPNAQNLGERVLESCATKLKPYLVEAVATLGISLDDYSKVLASVCQETSGSLEQNDACASSENAADEGKSVKATLNESMQAIEEDSKKATPSQQDTVVDGRSSKSVTSNGIVQSSEDDLLADPKSLKKQEDVNNSDHSKGMNISSNEDPNNVNSKKVDNTEQKPEQATKRRRKQYNSTKLAEPSESSAVARDRDAEKMLDSKSNKKELCSSLDENHSTEGVGPSENDKESHAKISSRKAGNNESEAMASPSPSLSHPDENHSKKSGRRNKKGRPAKEVAISSEGVAKKVSEVTCDSDAKPTKRSAKKAPGEHSDGRKTNAVDSVEKTSESTSGSEGKRRSTEKEDRTNRGVGSSLKHLKENKRQKQGKVSDLDVAKSANEEKETVSSPKTGTRLIKDEQYLEKTPKKNLKRKSTPGKDDSDIKVYGENLVGSRVKVWWPEDHEFYSGTIESFDSAKKKHKVAYDDGDTEILNLRRERWDFVQDGDGHASADDSADVPSNRKRKKSASQSTKGRNTDTPSKSGGSASGKSKGASTKSGHKLKDGGKLGSKSKDSKSIPKSEDGVRKSKDHASRSGSNKPADAVPMMTESNDTDTDTPKTSKTKNDDVIKPKFSSKTKQENPKKPQKETLNSPASKGRPPKNGGKSNVNVSGKAKSGSSKTKDAKNEFSADSTEKVDDMKGKASSSSKTQGSAAKAGKKRQRG
ncbi:sister chromatid cohesion protein PDS5 homolog C isoform X2 [Prosopis cineraria]|uniref:sister chromatid cohesion protein PDS5 homolog C isoform X2 n=1 Tax=Prosopis cineraria TaxID=364024 RepID=UPI00240EB69A|nr:sister chromatid cohesion protein PDS5 homolog C isoform X2 [Prosopis cineraria]